MFAITILGYTFAMMWLILVAAVWIMIAFWPALLAKGKGYSFWLFLLLSIPFWWITLFVALFIHDKNQPVATPPAAPTAE